MSSDGSKQSPPGPLSDGSGALARPPGAVSPGAVSPGAVSPGAVSPGAASPGGVSRAPGAVSSGAVSAGAQSAAISPASELLLELEHLLSAERDALVRLDRDAIEAFATRKLELDAELRQLVAAQPLVSSERALLERVRQAALSNQLLLAHARSCVQGVLTLLAPGNAPGYSAPGQAHPSAAPPPLALNFRS
jgi:flagellar biosynthesis/type III secretory pathway chaperone